MRSTQKQTNTKLALPFFILALVLAAAGCSSTPKAWNVSVTKVTPASIEVDLVGISPSEKPYWQNSVSVDDYWKNGSIRRGAQKVSTNFQGGALTWTIKTEDPIWKDWFGYGATELMVIANLPGKYEGGPYDRRRIFLPLERSAWKAKDKMLQVQIQDEFVRVLTPQKQK
jgi:hypothetical protein